MLLSSGSPRPPRGNRVSPLPGEEDGFWERGGRNRLLSSFPKGGCLKEGLQLFLHGESVRRAGMLPFLSGAGGRSGRHRFRPRPQSGTNIAFSEQVAAPTGISRRTRKRLLRRLLDSLHEITEVEHVIRQMLVLLDDVGECLRIDQRDRQLLVERVVVPIHLGKSKDAGTRRMPAATS